MGVLRQEALRKTSMAKTKGRFEESGETLSKGRQNGTARRGRKVYKRNYEALRKNLKFVLGK